MSDNASFKRGAKTYPLATATGNSSLYDADPFIFYALEFYANVLQTYLGPKILEATSASAAASAITSAVAMTVPFDPVPSLNSTTYKFPLLGVYRKSGTLEYRTVSWRHDVSTFEIVYILPPLEAAGADVMVPFLSDVRDVLDDRTSLGSDPAYTPTNGSLGQTIWVSLAGAERVVLTEYELGVLAGEIDNLHFYTLRMRGTVSERADVAASAFSNWNGADVAIDLTEPNQKTVIPDFIDISTNPAPVPVSISPQMGSASGGTSVTITGTGFVVGTNPTVKMGNVYATSVIVVSATTITCVTPAHDAYITFAADVVVTNADGLSGTLPASYTFVLPPILSGSNFAQGDPLGGGASIVLSGTNLGSATGVSFGGTAATITGNTNTTVTCTLPAKAAGVTTVSVTTTGGASNALTFEFWNPATEPSCTLLCESPNYSLDGSNNGTWTAGVGQSLSEVSPFAPAASGGAPSFAGSQDLFTSGTNKIGALMKMVAPCAGSFACVLAPSSAGTYDSTNPFNSTGIWSDVARGAIGSSFSTAGFEVFASTAGGYKKATVAQAADGNPHCMQMRFADSDVIGAQVDAAAWQSTAITTYSPVTTSNVWFGKNFNNSHDLSGAVMTAVAYFNIKLPDSTATKFYQWSRQRHGVA